MALTSDASLNFVRRTNRRRFLIVVIIIIITIFSKYQFNLLSSSHTAAVTLVPKAGLSIYLVTIDPRRNGHCCQTRSRYIELRPHHPSPYNYYTSHRATTAFTPYNQDEYKALLTANRTDHCTQSLRSVVPRLQGTGTQIRRHCARR
jgi:hypothetical protein